MKHFKICVFFSLGILCYAQQDFGRQMDNLCTSKVTCGNCIAAHPQCNWCSAEDFNQHGSRCDFNFNLLGNCREDQIVAPAHMQILKLKEEGLGQKGVKGEINLTPQEIDLKLRSESSILLDVKFRQSQYNPVDLYLLTDLSSPMKDDKGNVDKLADLLSEEIRNITQNFRLGFGSFVGQAVMDYANTEQGKQKTLCTGCTAPYGFHSHISLTMDTNSFVRRVQDAKVTGNLNNPGGVLDAVMQAIVCQNEIGWRKKSEKILIFTSNSGVHYDGDGKLDKILKPDDGLCHLDPMGYYSENIHQDYPSLSQINRKIQENEVKIIFAVTAEQLPEYLKLSSLLVGSSVVQLGSDSSHLIDLVRNIYYKRTSAVEMKDTAGRNIKVTYHSTCLGDDDEKKETNICDGLKAGTNVTFQVHVKVTSCPEDPSDWIQTFQIYPVGADEALTVNLEMTCDCDCEKPGNKEKNSRMCHGNGTYECGICNCNNNRFGRKCECDANGPTSLQDARACQL